MRNGFFCISPLAYTWPTSIENTDDYRLSQVHLALGGLSYGMHSQSGVVTAISNTKKSMISMVSFAVTFSQSSEGVAPFSSGHRLMNPGPIARVGPNDLITCSPELLAHMSAVRSPYTRSMKYRESRVKPGEDHVFSQIDEEKHRIRRHQMASGVCHGCLGYDDLSKVLFTSIRAKKISNLNLMSINGCKNSYILFEPNICQPSID